MRVRESGAPHTQGPPQNEHSWPWWLQDPKGRVLEEGRCRAPAPPSTRARPYPGSLQSWFAAAQLRDGSLWEGCCCPLAPARTVPHREPGRGLCRRQEPWELEVSSQWVEGTCGGRVCWTPAAEGRGKARASFCFSQPGCTAEPRDRPSVLCVWVSCGSA